MQAAIERSRLSALNERIQVVQRRILSMTGSTKAITLFARTKYPAAEVARFGTYTTMLDGMHYPSLTEPLDDTLAPFGALTLHPSDLTPDDEVCNPLPFHPTPTPSHLTTYHFMACRY